MPSLTETRKRNDAARRAAHKAIRHAHPEEFAAILEAESARGGRCRQAAHQAAEKKLTSRYPAERDAANAAYRLSAGLPRRDLSKVVLVKRKRVRDDIDRIDAFILFDRGMTAPEIARYDNCTAKAVLQVLVPMLRGKGWSGRAIQDRLAVEWHIVQKAMAA